MNLFTGDKVQVFRFKKTALSLADRLVEFFCMGKSGVQEKEKGNEQKNS